MKILIIDDEAYVLKSLKRNIIIFDCSIGVDLAESVQEALSKLAESEYDCIVSDLNMPNEDGLSLINSLKAQNINTPLIIMTGCPKAESAVECMKTGAADFISKPFSAETLMEKVKEHCSAQKPWNEGYQIKDYSLKELISETPSSLVFTAEKKDSDEIFAIKALKNEEIVVNKTAFNRFKREIQTLCELSHPNIIKILDFGLSEHGIPFIVMPFIEGCTLKENIDELSENEFLDILLILAETFTYIHSLNMVHRDIKPGNIIISNGVPILIDFGIILVKHSIQLTQEGMIVGTPNYMAPEALTDSHGVDYRADLYSLGIILYRYAYKKCPYEANDVYGVIKNLISTKDDELFKGSKYDELIKKLINKEPDHRLDSAFSLLEELNKIKLSISC
ncbi:MAG: response regulator [Lentisphaeraceae bacterium]|nr:response regulator [Lentisphaeraceae bacterium]